MNPAAWLLILGAPLLLPPFIYFAVKAGRYGWLRAEQLFFRETPNGENDGKSQQ